MTTEPRTFVGETSTPAFDGMAGFRLGQRYELSYTHEFDEVRITLSHSSPGAGPLCCRWRSLRSGLRSKVTLVGAPMGTGVTVSSEQWGKWFGK